MSGLKQEICRQLAGADAKNHREGSEAAERSLQASGERDVRFAEACRIVDQMLLLAARRIVSLTDGTTALRMRMELPAAYD
jgi:hypothetical protein